MKSSVKFYVSLIFIISLCASCQSTGKPVNEHSAALSKQGIMLESIHAAEQRADEHAKAVLETGRSMVLEEKAILPGTCWTWVNECYNRAGFESERHIAFRSKKWGPYVNVDEIKPGDWLYFVNHSYRNMEHSGIFVYWVDKEKKIGVTLCYRGLNKEEPGRYRKYYLKDVYYITRPGTE